jgi:Ca2+-binding RTX toxin-like protein
MCVFCHLRGRSQDSHAPDEIAPDPFEAFPVPRTDETAIVVNNDDSAPDGLNTTNSMDVGDTFSGVLDAQDDEDWIAISLTAGQTVEFSVSGLPDYRLELMDSTGGFEGLRFNAALVEEITETGTYYIKIEEFFSQIGAYDLTVTDVTPFPPSLTYPMRTIDWGTELSTNTITYYFAGAGEVYSDSFGPVTGEAWNAYEITRFEAAFDMIEAVADVNFVRSFSPAADFVLFADSNEISSLGFFNPPDEANAGEGVFAVDSWDRFAGGDLETGGFGFVTIVHELLHGMGLAHPHDGGGSSFVMSGVSADFDDTGTYQLNQGVYTTMTYNSGFYEGAVGTATPSFFYGHEAGPMALDIALLQYKYGANMTTGAGDDVYVLADANQQGTAYQSIWDTGGSDTLRYDGARDATIDLRAATLEHDFGGGGYVSGATGIAGGFTIAYGVEIENAQSGAGDDALHGTDGANSLTAGAGDDTITAYRGNDTIMAGSGDDDVSGLGGNDFIEGGAGRDTIRGGRENDTILGGDGNDVIRSQRDGDSVEGGAGNDNIKGGGGNDTLIGDDGNDFLKGGTRRDVIDGGAGNDTLAGNSFTDTLNGGAGDDTLNGGGDNDVLNGGTGSDTMKGGGGADDFIFALGDGIDFVTDFDVGSDELLISTALAGGLTEQQIADAATLSGADVILDFGNGDVITLQGLGDTTGLAGAIEIF